tara:strand:- start:1488 stop:1685 length:198 start_codon:yes stop_codon:yes gene_type:complete
MYKVNLVKTPMCDYENCDKTAIFEFTDVVKVDPKSFPTKTITIGYSCDDHVDKVNKKLRGKRDAE